MDTEHQTASRKTSSKTQVNLSWFSEAIFATWLDSLSPWRMGTCDHILIVALRFITLKGWHIMLLLNWVSCASCLVLDVAPKIGLFYMLQSRLYFSYYARNYARKKCCHPPPYCTSFSAKQKGWSPQYNATCSNRLLAVARSVSRDLLACSTMLYSSLM